MRVAVLACLLALSACATTCPPPVTRIETQIVRTAVPTPCHPTLTAEPQYADRSPAIATMGIADAAREWRIGREQRDARIAELTGALAACSTLPAAP